MLQLKGKAANRLMTWETIQKEDFLTNQSKIQKSSDSERLKRMSVKWAHIPTPSYISTMCIFLYIMLRWMSLFYRVDGVVKHLTETRDFDHRLRALETEVKLKSSIFSPLISYLTLAYILFILLCHFSVCSYMHGIAVKYHVWSTHLNCIKVKQMSPLHI